MKAFLIKVFSFIPKLWRYLKVRLSRNKRAEGRRCPKLHRLSKARRNHPAMNEASIYVSLRHTDEVDGGDSK